MTVTRVTPPPLKLSAKHTVLASEALLRCRGQCDHARQRRYSYSQRSGLLSSGAIHLDACGSLSRILRHF